MTEQDIRNAVVEKLTTDFQDYEIRDFPITLSNYNPVNPNGELLLKSLGYRPVNYLDRNNQVNPLSFGRFIVYDYQWQIDVVVKDFRTEEQMFEITEKIASSMSSIEFTQAQVSRFFTSDVSAVGFDEEKQYQFRTLLFSLLSINCMSD